MKKSYIKGAFKGGFLFVGILLLIVLIYNFLPEKVYGGFEILDYIFAADWLGKLMCLGQKCSCEGGICIGFITIWPSYFVIGAFVGYIYSVLAKNKQ